jgi:hypothetical protein
VGRGYGRHAHEARHNEAGVLDVARVEHVQQNQDRADDDQDHARDP